MAVLGPSSHMAYSVRHFAFLADITRRTKLGNTRRERFSASSLTRGTIDPFYVTLAMQYTLCVQSMRGN